VVVSALLPLVVAAGLPVNSAATMMRSAAEYFGWHAVRVSRLSSKSSSTDTSEGSTIQ
jgi:hypothetical protein